MMCGITGTPGTGKSAIGTELESRGYRVIHLATTIGPYVTGVDEDRDAQIVDVERWADEFVPIDGFVEGHLAHYLPCDKIIVLRCRPDVLRTRLAMRKYREEKIRENIEAEALDSILIETDEIFEPGQILEIDTTERTSQACAEIIEGFMLGNIPAGYGTIDWSEYLEAGL